MTMFLKKYLPKFLIHMLSYIYAKIRFVSKVKFSYTCRIHPKCCFEGMNQIHPHTKFKGKLGFGSYIGNNCDLSANIGRFTSIAPNVVCNYGIHPYAYPFVSTAPCFYSLNPTHSQNGSTFAKKQLFNEHACIGESEEIAIEIGNDCWIGDGAFLVGGVRICDGAVVLAHAVVTKDVPPYAIVGGVPAKIIKYRYDSDTIAFLKSTQWWNKDVRWFKKHWECMSDIDAFKELVTKEEIEKCNPLK